MRTLKRRRKENKTDYKKRLAFLKSGVARVVFRKTNRYVTAQIVSSKEAQDKVELGMSSQALIDYGWPDNFKNSLKSVSASYLTGFLLGKLSDGKKTEKIVVDFGMIRMIHKNKLFAFLKGLKDSGMNVQCDEEQFPSEDRVKGKHLKEDFSKTFEVVKSNIEKGSKIETKIAKPKKRG